MFESGYPFKVLTVAHPIDEAPLIKKVVYEFRTDKNRRYLAHIHEYDNKAFVIKFHDARHKNQGNRYHLLLNDFDCPKVLRTVIDIARETLNNEPFASFAFVGVPIEGKENKDEQRSQRHRIYRRLSENLLGSQTFIHGYEEKSNCYLLVNKKHTNPEAMYETIVDMFAKEFVGIEDI